MIVYCATAAGARKAQQQFAISYTHLRRFYEGPVSVLTDLDSGWPHDGYELIPFTHHLEGFGARTVLPSYIKAEQAIHLDCDVLPVRRFDELWSLEPQIEFAIARDFMPDVGQAAHHDSGLTHKWNKQELDHTIALVGARHPYFNAGVFHWRNTDRVRYLFMIWHHEWIKFRGSSQYALVRALHHMRFVPAILPVRYNAFGGAFVNLEDASRRGATFLHYWQDMRMPPA